MQVRGHSMGSLEERLMRRNIRTEVRIIGSIFEFKWGFKSKFWFNIDNLSYYQVACKPRELIEPEDTKSEEYVDLDLFR